MTIRLDNVGKRYRLEWIFRGLSVALEAGERWAILGPNGSGKSTLLKVLSGHLTPSKGNVHFENQGATVPEDAVYKQISYAAPYIELIEEFTLHEAVRFHQRFRPLLPGLDADALTEVLGLQKSRNLPVSSFSSGMKQRLKIALACCTTSDYILLDEPTTNLDTQGMDWYQRILAQYVGDRLLVIASNVADDYRICGAEIDILRYK